MSLPNNFVMWALQGFARQRWIRQGLRDRVVRACVHPARVRPHAFTTEFFGLRYSGDLSSFIDWTVFFYGAYEKEELEYLARLISTRPGAVFLDIGANVGHHTLFMSRVCAAVHSFEPFGPVREKLESKLAENAVTNVTVHSYGCGRVNERRMFFAPEGANHATGSFMQSRAADNNRPVGEMAIVRADSFFEERGLDRLDLVKIDVEGLERDVLEGLQQTLIRYRPIVVLEYSHDTHNSFVSESEFRSMFPSDYGIKVLASNRPIFGVFNRPACTEESFVFGVSFGNLLISPTQSERTPPPCVPRSG